MNTDIPQGSVLRPKLWNILYDGVLELNSEITRKIAIADNLVLHVIAILLADLRERSVLEGPRK